MEILLVRYPSIRSEHNHSGSIKFDSWPFSSASLITYPVSPMKKLINVLAPPRTAQIEITNRCNLRCQMCPLSKEDYEPIGRTKNMSLAEFQRIMDKLPPLESVSLQGLGEPLLNKELVEIINYAVSKGTAVYFFTNSTLLTPIKARELILSGLSTLNMSLDGATATTYETIRQGAKFSIVADNIKNMARLRMELQSKTPYLNIMFVGMKENVREIPELIHIAVEWGVDKVTVKNLYEDAGISGTALTEDDIDFLQTECSTLAKAMQLDFSYPSTSVMTNEKSRMTCRWPWDSAYITANGFVTPCCFSFDGDFMNIFETEFNDIWNSKSMQDFRDELADGFPRICQSCPAYSVSMITV